MNYEFLDIYKKLIITYKYKFWDIYFWIDCVLVYLKYFEFGKYIKDVENLLRFMNIEIKFTE